MPDATADRKLAAILSADVVGYSRLMGDNEHATLATLNEYRALMREHITSRRGRVVDSPGDALLAEFPSAVQAVEAAIAIQDDLAKRNNELPENRRMLMRIGINLGDVIEQRDLNQCVNPAVFAYRERSSTRSKEKFRRASSTLESRESRISKSR